ncbi:MAG: HAMP domain-containing sensor histidine kinase [Planctomycetota bacterium]|nr:HAMP domain-containing sensor histidine kinase [Planctomycetota bacterium]
MAILGALSSVLLVVLALAPSNDPELAGRTAFSKLAGEVEDAVAAEWERALVDSGFAVTERGESWTRMDEALVAQRARVTESAPAPAEGPAFEVLLAEALRLEASENPAEARKAALEALSKARHAHGKARAALVAIRAGKQAKDCAGALETWRGVRGALDGREHENGMPLVVLAALAVAPCASPEERAESLRQVASVWDGVAVDGVDASVASAAVERLLALAPEGDAARELRESERVRELARFAVRLAEAHLPKRPDDARWHLEALGKDEWLLWRAEGADAVVASRMARGELLERFVERAKGAIPADFGLDFGAGASGEPVRERRTLDASGIGFTLRHENPQAAMRAEGTRMRLLRGALLLVALLSGLASFATWRAMRRSRKLSELKSSFVASVSHELRTPVASILMLAENLEEGRVSDAASRARYASLIRREAERLRRLVADVLDFSRLERGRELDLRREGVEVASFVAEMVREATEWAKSHSLELAVELAPLHGHAQLDTDAVRRALANLLDNARKHSGSTELTLSARTEARSLRLAVADRGRGVPAEQREKLFEPFERLEASSGAGGAGLGLAIVREIAREHGGRVRFVEPEGGVGARVELELPLEEGT